MGVEPVETSMAHILREPLSDVYNELEAHRWSVDDIRQMLPIMMDLLRIKEFSDLFEKDLREDTRPDFGIILKELQEIRPEFLEQNLLKILQDKGLVGKKIAEYFQLVRLDVDATTGPAPVSSALPSVGAPNLATRLAETTAEQDKLRMGSSTDDSSKKTEITPVRAKVRHADVNTGGEAPKRARQNPPTLETTDIDPGEKPTSPKDEEGSREKRRLE